MQRPTNTFPLSLPDERATRGLAETLTRLCRPGDLLLLRGPLGAGKTTFVDAFAKALEAGAATSPTFVIAHSYPHGRIPLWHLDLYRLADTAAVAELDLDQYLNAAAITLVEWPERAVDAWPADRIEIELGMAERGRSATILGFGSAKEVVAALQAAWS